MGVVVVGRAIHGNRIVATESFVQFRHECTRNSVYFAAGKHPPLDGVWIEHQLRIGAQTLELCVAGIAFQCFEHPGEVGDAMRAVSDPARPRGKVASILYDQQDHR